MKQIMTRFGWTHRNSVRIGARALPGYIRTLQGALPIRQMEAEEPPDDPFARVRGS